MSIYGLLGALYGGFGGIYVATITADQYDYDRGGWHYAWQYIYRLPLTVAMALVWPLVMVYMKVKRGEVWP